MRAAHCENGGGVNGSFSADTHIVLGALFEVSVDTTDTLMGPTPPTDPD